MKELNIKLGKTTLRMMLDWNRSAGHWRLANIDDKCSTLMSGWIDGKEFAIDYSHASVGLFYDELKSMIGKTLKAK